MLGPRSEGPAAAAPRWTPKLRGGTPARWDELIHETKRHVADHGLAAGVPPTGSRAAEDFPPAQEASCRRAGGDRRQLPRVPHLPTEGAERPCVRPWPQHGSGARTSTACCTADLAASWALMPPGGGAWRRWPGGPADLQNGGKRAWRHRVLPLDPPRPHGGGRRPLGLLPDPEQFHTEAARRRRESPATMNALTTHDANAPLSVRARSRCSPSCRACGPRPSHARGRRRTPDCRHGRPRREPRAAGRGGCVAPGAGPHHRLYADEGRARGIVSTAWVDGTRTCGGAVHPLHRLPVHNPRARGVLEGCVAR
ncbi:hypothetical protein QJS66_20690 [Kocuria rhizophila]|nr:hypothetical protein QJS66_20690 [Kocuria rhizophila]